MRAGRTFTLAILSVGLLVASVPPRTGAAPARPKLSLTAADTLAATPGPRLRVKALEEWAKTAPLDHLVFVLRRSHEELSDAEPVLLEAALKSTPQDRSTLRDRLAARLLLADPKRARKLAITAAPSLAIGFAPGTVSTFSVAVLAPQNGDYMEDGSTLVEAFRAGFASRDSGGLPITIEVVDTGSERPEEVAAAYDRAARRSGIVCGGLTPGSTVVLASASRWNAAPVVVPVPADPTAPRLSTRLWELGPTGDQRGRALASAVLTRGRERVGLFFSNARDTTFAAGFAAACREQGSEVVFRHAFAAGNASFTYEIRSLIAQKVTLLFWDGEGGETSALLRQLTRERVSLRICGGEGLAPERHHRETRVLLEGVAYVPEEWSLHPAAEAELSARTGSETGATNDPLRVRGFLAGRLVAQAVASRPLTPEEVTASLQRNTTPGQGERRLLAVQAQGALLPIFKVASGKAVRTP